MREGKRRILSILTALALVLGLCTPLGGLLPEAEAAEIVESGICGENMTWTLDSEGTLTISGAGDMEDFELAASSRPWGRYLSNIEAIVIQNGITSIGDYAFSIVTNSDNDYIKSVSIPSSVTRIGDNAFRNCGGLENITISDNVTEVGKGAFEGAGLRSVTVGNGITELPDSAFAGCSSLTDVTLSEGLKVISTSAFWGCISLEGIKLPDSVTAVYGGAFENCSALEYVVLGSGITEFGGQHQGDYSQSSVFYQCTSLRNIYYPGSQEEFSKIKNSSYVAGMAGIEVHYNSNGPGDTDPKPEVPTSIIPTPILDEPTCTKEGVSLSWTLPLEVPDQPHTVDGFYILRKTAGGSYQRVGQVGAYTHLYTDTSVQEGQTYTYTVQAYYQDQTGDYDQSGKTITFTRPVTDPVTVEVKNVEFRIEGGKNGLNTDTLWTGAQSHVYIYIKEDAGIEHGSDPGYVVLMDRDTGTQLWRSDTVHYYNSNSISDTHHFDFVFRPEDCAGGYLPSGRKIQFRIMDDTGKEILTYNCETFPLQLWSFGNPSVPFDQEFLEQFYSESRAKAIFKAAKSDTLGGDGLCLGMSLLVSLINSDGIGDIGFSGCAELGQAQKDTPLTGSMKGYTALDLIKACQARQYFDSIVRQREENREDLTGLIDAVESYERGIGAMPVVIISVPQEGEFDYVHALAAYAAEPDGKGNMRIDVYDPNHPDIIGSYVLIYNYESSDSYWVYREQFRGGEGELRVQGQSLIDDIFKKHGLTYFTSRSYPMQQEDDIWISISGYDFSTLKDGGLDITALDPDRFQGLNAAWVSGQGTLSLSGLTAQAEIADDETYYTIDANGGSTDLTLKEGLDSIHVTGEGTLTITCDYEGENGTVTTRFSGTAKDGVSVSRNGDTVRFSGGESGTVTVTYENGKTWTEQVEPGKDLSVTADGKNEPSTGGKNEPSGDKNESSTNSTVSQVPDSVRVFDDISSDDYFYDAVVWAVEHGVTTGTGPNTFSPYRPCTRAEVVTLLWRALGLDEGSVRSTDNPFADVDEGDYFRDAVLWAAEYGITTGTDERHFSPDKTCTRAEVVTFLWRSHFPMEVVMDEGSFRDVNAWDYYALPVNWAVKEGITTGTGEGTFSPNMICTRSQVVTFLYRYFGN